MDYQVLLFLFLLALSLIMWATENDSDPPGGPPCCP